MKFEVYLNCCLARGYWYTAAVFQLNDVIPFTIHHYQEDDIIGHKTGSEAFYCGLSIGRVQKHGSKGHKNSGSV